MTTTATLPRSATNSTPLLSLSYRASLAQERRASQKMYDAEVALHAARQADMDEWIAAASVRLHEAICAHLAAAAELAIAGALCEDVSLRPHPAAH